MTRPSFQLGDVITGEPHLYTANPASPPPDSPLESHSVSQPTDTSLLKRFVAAVGRTFRAGPTPEDALAKALAP
jgi:hypothetical protein